MRKQPKAKSKPKAPRRSAPGFESPLDEIERLLKDPDAFEARIVGLARDSAAYSGAFVAMAQGATRHARDVSESELAELEAAREAILTAAFDIDHAFLHRVAERTYAEVRIEQLKAAARAHREIAKGLEVVLRSLGHTST